VDFLVQRTWREFNHKGTKTRRKKCDAETWYLGGSAFVDKLLAAEMSAGWPSVAPKLSPFDHRQSARGGFGPKSGGFWQF
jgi:hypothetical protein